jgi:hypothetical protein
VLIVKSTPLRRRAPLRRIRKPARHGLALNIFKVEPGYVGRPGLWFGGAFERRFSIHRDAGSGWTEQRGMAELDEAVSRGWSEIHMQNTAGFLSPTNMVQWTERRFDELDLAFQSGEKGEKLVRSAQWLFDSYVGRSELLGFVQTMVAFEILLGDDKENPDISLSQLLRNRCAFLVGSSHADREAILSGFSDIYKVRSKIVHAGKDRLTNDEREMFYRLRGLCARVIEKELALLAADLRSPVVRAAYP